MSAVAVGAAVAGAATSYGLSQMDQGSTGTQSQSSSSAPWGPQQDYLTYGFGQAKDLYNKAMQNPVYQGQRVADLNPYSSNVGNLVGNFAPTSFNYGTGALGNSAGVQGTGSQFANNAAGLFGQYNGVDPTQQILNNASQYANSPYAQGLIDAAGRDVTRNLNENQLPTLAKAAAGSGNTNSTRAGVESAIAQRGAADRLADISSGIRGQLFNTGLQQSQNQYNQNLQNSLAANNQLYNAFNSGNNGMLQGQQMVGNAFDQGTGAGSLFQNQNQAQLNAAMQKFSEENNVPLDLLAKYQAIVNGNYGGTGTQTTSGTPATASTGNTLLGGAALGYGLYNKMGGFNTTNNTSTPAVSSGSYQNAINSNTGTGNSWYSGMWG